MKNHHLLFALAALTAGVAQAGQRPDEIPVARGDNIDEQASNCSIGPFGQTGKAGQYNPYCTQLTDAEKCLALVKANMADATGVLSQATYDQDRVNFCLDEFRRGLTGN